MSANPLSSCLRWVALFVAVSLGAQSRFDDDGFPQLSAESAAQVLRQFRQSGLIGDVCFRFEIVHQPRRGESSAPLRGLVWAASNMHAGTLLRVELDDPQGGPGVSFISIKKEQGARSSLWVSRQGSAAVETVADGQGEPLAPGLLITPFDLQLPFTHWTQTRYAGTERSRGRPVHFFEATNPQAGQPAQVRFAVDRAYGALVQAVSLDAQSEKIRLLQVEEFSKVDEQWVLGECSIRDERSRDVDRLRFTAAALGLKLPASTFDPATLTRRTAPPANFKPL